jgi:hypothetical protein
VRAKTKERKMKRKAANRREIERQVLSLRKDSNHTSPFVPDAEPNAQNLALGNSFRAHQGWHNTHFSPERRGWHFKTGAKERFNKH